MAEAARIEAGDLSVELDPAAGGCVSAFHLRREGAPFDLMRPLGGSAALPPDALHSGMFPMVPFANCIRDNLFGFAGRRYSVQPNMRGARLNFHGSGWQSPWRIASAGPRHVELVLDDGRVDGVYSYSAIQRFVLDETGLSVETVLANRGEVRMPFTFGQHPWFPTHGEAQIRFGATGLWLGDAEGQAERLVSVSSDTDYSAPRPAPAGYRNICYAGWDGTASVLWPQDGVRLDIAADPIFGHLMFHVPADGQPVVCLEPQTNAPCTFDGLEQGRVASGVHILDPGAEISGVMRFSVAS
jgi:aldose 1-epimerase